MDWIDDPQKREQHNYDSSGVGTNRYATILLYMSNITEGGETVFKKAWRNDVPQSQRKSRQVSLEELRKDGTVDLFERGSWEESMVADCRSRLAIRPYPARAVLFYSQHPNGEEDTSSLHGGCPVLEGEKWAANLWVRLKGIKLLLSFALFIHTYFNFPLYFNTFASTFIHNVRYGMESVGAIQDLPRILKQMSQKYTQVNSMQPL